MIKISGGANEIMSQLMNMSGSEDDLPRQSSSFRSALSAAMPEDQGRPVNLPLSGNLVESLRFPGTPNSAGGAPPVPDQGAVRKSGSMDPAQVLMDAAAANPQVAPEFQSAVDAARAKNLWAARSGMIAGTVKSLKETGKQLLQA